MSGPNVLTAAENIDEVTMDETFGTGIKGVCLYVPLWTLHFKLELRLRVEEISELFPTTRPSHIFTLTSNVELLQTPVHKCVVHITFNEQIDTS